MRLGRGRSIELLGCSPSQVGGKAANLIWLDRAGARVPKTWVVRRSDRVEEVLGEAPVFAVRSSFDEEDGAFRARAGEFLTLLDVPPDRLESAVQQVLAAPNRGSGGAVVIQEMIPAVVSGVAFSRNPVTGLSDIVVEAIRGRGEQILAQGADPMRWTSHNGRFVELPRDGRDLDQLISQVVAGTTKLSRSFGPADLEWVWDGEVLWWVQIRPITSIRDVPIFSRRISKDVMPGLIKPLVWSVNVPMVNSAWVRLITEAIGPNDLDPERLAASFAYRSYFDMRAFGDIFESLGMPRDSLENLLGLHGEKTRMKPSGSSFLKLPRLLFLSARRAAGTGSMERQRQSLQVLLEEASAAHLDQFENQELIAHIRRLEDLGARAAYLNIVIPLLANGFANLLRRRLEKAGIDPEVMEPDPAGGHDLRDGLGRIRESFERMAPADIELALGGDLSRLDDSTAARLDAFVGRFGHLSESVNDMSAPRWREDPLVVLRLAVQTNLAQDKRAIPGSHGTQRMGRIRRLRIGRLGKRVKKLSIQREAVGSTFAYGYGLLRPAFLELGRRLVERDFIDYPEDVFFLSEDEAIDALVDGRATDPKKKVEAVKTEMESVADLIMPDTIIGDRWLPESDEVATRLQGVGTSRGRYRGTARFIGSIEDAAKLEEGQVLVIDRSDIAWTFLFSRAGAVITEAGGLLAHSSITARELGVPCVSSVARARLLDGLTVLVDGTTGEVLVES